MVALCLVAALHAQPPASTPADAPRPGIATPPAVQVFAILAPEFGYQATVAYDRVVSRAEAKLELQALAQGLGYESVNDLRRWAPGEKERRELEYRASERGSEIGFRLSERAFFRGDGRFKVEPFIAAYRQYGRIDIDLVVGKLDQAAFRYKGLRDYDDRYVRLRYHGADPTYSFQVEVLDPSFERLDLPPYAPPEEPLQSTWPPDRNRVGWREWLGLVLLAAGSATVAYLLVRRGGRRRVRRRSGRLGRRR
jgi:hypothetical protein